MFGHKIHMFKKEEPVDNNYYRKVPKFSDTRKLCCNLHKIQTKRQNLRVFCQKMQIEKQTVKTLIRLHCLPRPICPKTKVHYGMLFT